MLAPFELFWAPGSKKKTKREHQLGHQREKKTLKESLCFVGAPKSTPPETGTQEHQLKTLIKNPPYVFGHVPTISLL